MARWTSIAFYCSPSGGCCAPLWCSLTTGSHSMAGDRAENHKDPLRCAKTRPFFSLSSAATGHGMPVEYVSIMANFLRWRSMRVLYRASVSHWLKSIVVWEINHNQLWWYQGDLVKFNCGAIECSRLVFPCVSTWWCLFMTQANFHRNCLIMTSDISTNVGRASGIY